MTDNKLTDNEIKKALECCSKNSITGWFTDCEKCPLKDNSKCITELNYKVLDLINRLQAELNQYAQEQHDLMVEKDTLFDIAEKLQAENERLRKECGNQSNLWSNHYEGLYQTALGTIKPKAYKEFAELVQGEIDDALHSNYNAKEERYEKCKKHGIPIDAEDSFLMYCDGKIHALSGLQSFVSNTLKELVGDKNEM